MDISSAWGMLTSGYGLSLAMALTAFVAAYIFAKWGGAKDWWIKYEGFILAAIKEAEKVAPEGGRLEFALTFVIAIIEKIEGKKLSVARKWQLENEISKIHEKMEIARPTGKLRSLKNYISAGIAEQAKNTGGGRVLPTVLLLVSCVLLAPGCFIAPKAVDNASGDAIKAIGNVSANQKVIFDSLKNQLVKERVANVALAMDKDLAEAKAVAATEIKTGPVNMTTGKPMLGEDKKPLPPVDPEKAIANVVERTQQIYKKRDQKYKEVQEIINLHETQLENNQEEAARAAGLVKGVRQYNNTGMDPVKTAEAISGGLNDLATSIRKGDK
jgi:hypothetical protein